MTQPILTVSELVKHFRIRGGVVRAVDRVSFTLAAGETLGLVGESGCGKSTLGKTLIRLIDPDAGRIEFAGRDISALGRAALHPVRRNMQMIFQDPYASLNPRLTVAQALSEPFIVHGIGAAEERRRRVLELLQRVGLRPEQATLYPHEFSGGQRQRICIARAIALEPKLVVCDEPVSALDVSIQAQIVNLLLELKTELDLSYIFITHDLSLLAYIADRVAVMYLGEIVEVAERTALWRRRLHPYTQILFSAVPVPDPRAGKDRGKLRPRGEPASPINPPAGCRFHPRCPFAQEICAREAPALREAEPGHAVSCHLVGAAADGSPAGPAQPASA